MNITSLSPFARKRSKMSFPLSYIPFLLPVSSPTLSLRPQDVVKLSGCKNEREREWEQTPNFLSSLHFLAAKDRSDPRFLPPRHFVWQQEDESREGGGRPRSWRDGEGFPLTSGPWVTLIVCSLRCICELHKVSGLFLAFIALSLSFAKILSIKRAKYSRRRIEENLERSFCSRCNYDNTLSRY